MQNFYNSLIIKDNFFQIGAQKCKKRQFGGEKKTKFSPDFATILPKCQKK
jgi:hypothetical protein